VGSAQTNDASGESTGLNRALVVEDNFVVARETKQWLKEIGFKHVATVSNIPHALKHLQENDYDFCLIDVNLRGSISEPVAKKLTELQIPFVFASGYGSEGKEMCDSYEATLLTKPIDKAELSKIIELLDIAK